MMVGSSRELYGTRSTSLTRRCHRQVFSRDTLVYLICAQFDYYYPIDQVTNIQMTKNC